MVLSLRPKKIIYYIVSIIIFLGVFLYIKIQNKTATIQNSKEYFSQELKSEQVPATINYKSPTICQDVIQKYKLRANISSSDQRFMNIHKKVGDTIYRFRFFYKDGDENEIPTYLLYEEKVDGSAVIIEKNKYEKGKQYQKIEEKTGEIIYREEGLNLDDHLFLHYINDQLVDAHGLSQNINCQY